MAMIYESTSASAFALNLDLHRDMSVKPNAGIALGPIKIDVSLPGLDIVRQATLLHWTDRLIGLPLVGTVGFVFEPVSHLIGRTAPSSIWIGSSGS
jgi:hypothetical protein